MNFNNPSDLYDIIDSIDWFSKIGNPIIIKDLSYTPVKDIKTAIKLWDSSDFLEARSVAWEAFRQEIVKDSKLCAEWVTHFKQFNKLLIKSLRKSDNVKELIHLTNQTVENFARGLPFTGALGEMLIFDKFPNYIFNFSQLPFYTEGHWVCGWSGTLSKNDFVYPKSNFMVY